MKTGIEHSNGSNSSLLRSQESVFLAGPPLPRAAALRQLRSLLDAEASNHIRVLTARHHWEATCGTSIDEVWNCVADDLALFDALLRCSPAWISAVSTSTLAGAARGALHLTLLYEVSGENVLGQIEVSGNLERGFSELAVQEDHRRIVLVEGASSRIDVIVSGDREVAAAEEPQLALHGSFSDAVEPPDLDRIDPTLAVARSLDAARRSLKEGGLLFAVPST